VSFIALFGLAVSLHAAVFDVSHQPANTEDRKKLVKVTTNDVVLIKAQSGAVAVVQFTKFDPYTDSSRPSASYRWRYRPATSQVIQSGKGQVRESYNRKPTADGKDVEVTPKADHDPTLRAGDIWIEWSSNNELSGWLYYYPTRATIQILSSDAFDRAL
jgi:hypothetical protein